VFIVLMYLLNITVFQYIYITCKHDKKCMNKQSFLIAHQHNSPFNVTEGVETHPIHNIHDCFVAIIQVNQC